MRDVVYDVEAGKDLVQQAESYLNDTDNKSMASNASNSSKITENKLAAKNYNPYKIKRL